MNSVSLYIGPSYIGPSADPRGAGLNPQPPGPSAKTPKAANRTSPQSRRALDAAFAKTPAGHKLHKAAGEFEAQLLSSLWKSMKESFAPDDDSSDPATQSFAEWGIDAMCNAVGKAGGLGIGKQIIQALETKMERLGTAPAPTSNPFQIGAGPSQEATMP